MTTSNALRVLIIPSVLRGNGTGHIVRSMSLAEGLIKLGADVSLLAGSREVDDSNYSLDEISKISAAVQAVNIITDADPEGFDLSVFDIRKTPGEFFARFRRETLCVGIDEGGASRADFDYLMDFLPNLETEEPNICSPAFLQLPDAVSGDAGADPEGKLASLKAEKGRRRILVSFGGEDRAGLSSIVAGGIIDKRIFEAGEITIVKGALFSEQVFPEGVNLLEPQPGLAAMLKDYDLVITSYGLTCFEALYSGVPVILFNPSDYHRRLSLKAGIPEIGVLKADLKRMSELVADGNGMLAAVRRYSGYERRDAAAHIAGLSGATKTCRGCESPHSEIIFRTETHSFFRCPTCSLANAICFTGTEVEYGPEYFFEDYKKQYGRTYLEDFDKIKAMGMQRCRVIRKFCSGNRLLDIGCGYGPFLSAASESGFKPSGIDISENAAEWVSSNLGFPTVASSVEDFSPAALGTDTFDAVTMWFVIEHIKSLPGVLEKINSILAPGGVFAFSTPNYNGISRLRSAEMFLRANPLDHYTVWSPASARRLLRRYGFRVKALRCPMIHPDRFFRPGRYESLPASIRRITGLIAAAAGRLFYLGDTFEVYAEKIKDCGETV